MKQPPKLQEVVISGPGVLKWRESDLITTHRIRLEAGETQVLKAGTFTWYEFVGANTEMAYEER